MLGDVHIHGHHWSWTHTYVVTGCFLTLVAFIKYGIPALCDLLKWWRKSRD